MLGYDYDFLDSGLEEVEAMYNEGYFDAEFPEYIEPEIPEIAVPDPVISSPAPKKTKKEAAKKPSKTKKTENKPVKKDKEPKVNTKKESKKEPKEEIKNEVKDIKIEPIDEELDDLILDKVSEKDPETAKDESEADTIPIFYDFTGLDEPPLEIEEQSEIKYEEPHIELRDDFEDEVEAEAISPVKEPEMSPEEPQDGYVYVEPFEEIDEVSDEEPEGVKYSPMLIKVLAFAAMLIVVIGLPVFLSSLRNKPRDKDNVSEVRAASTTEVVYQTVPAQTTYKNYEMTENSSRFKDLDDLSYYMDSNINATLSNEKALYNTYIAGGCTEDYYYFTLSGYIEFTDELSHLLTANKSLYKEEGKSDKYEELSEGLDNLMIYGDTIR